MLDLDKIKSYLAYFSDEDFNFDTEGNFVLPESYKAEWEEIDNIEYFPLYIDDYVQVFVSIISEKIMHILRRMRITLYNRVCAVKASFYNRIFSFFSLLFGLCNSQSAFIFHSLYGCSVSRIPS
jgi:hypothetical protein